MQLDASGGDSIKYSGGVSELQPHGGVYDLKLIPRDLRSCGHHYRTFHIPMEVTRAW